MLDSKVRFGDRVQNYKKYRPTYPSEAIEFIKETCDVKEDWKVADIGSGTGIATEVLLNVLQCQVFAVEPNEKMRSEAETNLSSNSCFHSINGSSENTTLEKSSMNMITAFQAFHWFDKEPTRIEFKRIILAPHWVVLVWNDRKTEGTQFLEKYEEILHVLPEYKNATHKNTDRKAIESFIGNSDLTFATFANSQKFDFEGLKGRFFSSSYTPAVGTAQYQVQIDTLKELFKNTNKNGFVEFVYTTQIYLGKMQ